VRLFVLILLVGYQSLFAFWGFDWFKSSDPLPPYALQHPVMTEESVYGVGNGKTFLEAKSKALNDIATQLRSNVRSITSVNKSSDADVTRTDQQITVLTQRRIDNYTVLDESRIGENTYLLVEYKRSPEEGK